jgi:hypothetical protein
MTKLRVLVAACTASLVAYATGENSPAQAADQVRASQGGLAQFELASGARVQIHFRREETERARERSDAIARFVWRDFCETQRYKRCNEGAYYTIDIYIDVAIDYCLASIQGKGAQTGISAFLEVGHYRCYTSRDGQKGLYLEDFT